MVDPRGAPIRIQTWARSPLTCQPAVLLLKPAYLTLIGTYGPVPLVWDMIIIKHVKFKCERAQLLDCHQQEHQEVEDVTFVHLNDVQKHQALIFHFIWAYFTKVNWIINWPTLDKHYQYDDTYNTSAYTVKLHRMSVIENAPPCGRLWYIKLLKM